MTPEKLSQYQNEIYTKIILDELQRQKANGVKIGDYILDKYAIDRLCGEKLKEILKSEQNTL